MSLQTNGQKLIGRVDVVKGEEEVIFHFKLTVYVKIKVHIAILQ